VGDVFEEGSDCPRGREEFSYVGGQPIAGVDPTGLYIGYAFSQMGGESDFLDPLADFLHSLLSGEGWLPSPPPTDPRYVYSNMDGPSQEMADWKADLADWSNSFSLLEAASTVFGGLCGSAPNVARTGYSGKTTVREILNGVKGSVKNAALPKGSPSWDEILDMTWDDILEAAKSGQSGYKTMKKLLLDSRFRK